MKKRNQNGFAATVFLFVVIATVLIGAVSFYVYKTRIDSKQSTPLMIVTSSGGMCAGQCEHRVYKLYSSGKFTGGGYKDLDSAEVSRLKNIIKDTNFLKYAPNPHPKCESFVDGSDQVLLFPQKYGDKTFTTCMLDIPSNDPAFTYIEQLLLTDYLHAD